MAASGSGSSQPRGTTNSAQSDDDITIYPVDKVTLRKYPLWKHVKVFKLNNSEGGNKKSECIYCHHVIPESYSRVKAHFLKIANQGVSICSATTPEMLEQFRKEDAAAKATEESSQIRSVPMPVQLSGISLSGSAAPSSSRTRTRVSKKGRQSSIKEGFNLEYCQMADAIIARMFYTGGIPFNLARNPNYRSSYNFVANHDMGGYVPPGINKLRTTLLQQEKANVERLLEPIKKTWSTKGVTIAADGWSDSQRRPLINFLAVTKSGPIFLKCENTEGKVKTKEYIVGLLVEVIEKVGPKNVVQVITDNAANCKAAGLIVEAKYKNIFWTPCVVHTLNLALKNICAPKNIEDQNPMFQELQWICDAAGDALTIKNFIMNHGMRLSIFNEYSKLKFLAIADTRFASVIVMLKRFRLLKESLQRMVISDKWTAYKQDDREKARFVRDKILDEDWWADVNYIIDFTDPIYSMLRAADTDKPCLHLIYEMWAA